MDASITTTDIISSASSEKGKKAQDSSTPHECEMTEPTTLSEMADHLSKLIRRHEDEQSKHAVEFAKSRRELEAALEKTTAICAAGEAALSDAYTKLETFATNKLPLLIKANVEAVAQAEIKAALEGVMRPLNEGVAGAVRDVEMCRSRINGLSWNWRLIVGPVTMGLITVIVGGGLVYFGVLGDMRRYSEWGKRVAAKIDTYSPKTREVLFQDFGGRP